MKKLVLAALCTVAMVMATNSCKHIPDYTDFIKNSESVSANCDPDTVYFENDVLPILTSNCGMTGCHDEGSQNEGVNVASYASLINSNIVVPGRPDKSKLIKAINSTKQEEAMPPAPRSSLSADQKAKISKWIEQGARNNMCLGGCDSTQYKFAANVWPIINNNCVGCHNSTLASGNVSFETYSQIKAQADNGQLLGTISYSPGYNPMPQGGNKLPDCQISVIRKWILNGAQNN